jgi:hypothetical protein
VEISTRRRLANDPSPANEAICSLAAEAAMGLTNGGLDADIHHQPETKNLPKREEEEAYYINLMRQRAGVNL